MNMNKKFCKLAVGLYLSTSLSTVMASHASGLAEPKAQVDDSMVIETIVVTAQKRSESIQEVPLAVTALSGSDLARNGVNNIEDLQSIIPNFNVGQQLGVARVNLRGIGLESLSAGAEGSIAFHVNGVFFSRSVSALASFYDIERVEVLRGPQGTLYGRNATGGAVNVVTKAPTDELSGYGKVTVGNYGRLKTEGALSGPLVPGVVLARFAFQTEGRDGYGTNLATSDKIDNLSMQSFRGTILIEPTDDLAIEVIADSFRRDDRSGAYHYLGSAGFSAPGVPLTPSGIAFGGETASDPRDINNESNPHNVTKFWGISGKVTYDMDAVQIISITSYRETEYNILTDLDSTSFGLTPIIQFEDATQFSQEFQVTGGGEDFDWLIGAYYLGEENSGGIIIPINDILFGGSGVLRQGYFGGGTIKTDAFAVFGQASYEVAPDLTLTIGGRYSTEGKKVDESAQFDLVRAYDRNAPLQPFAVNQNDVTFNSFTPRIALDYQATQDILLYASFSRGFKAGTYNLGGVQSPVNPEKVTSYEAGMKSTLFSQRVRFNLAGFYYDYTDLQVGKVIGNNLFLENAATATIYGLEAEMEARLTSELTINATASWLHARFGSYISVDPARPFGDGVTVDPDSGEPAFNLAGNHLSQSPEFTAFLGVEYLIPSDVGDFSLRGEVAWSDKFYFTPFNLDYVSEGPKTKVNAFLNFESAEENWHLSIFVKNLFDATYIGNAYVSSSLVGFPINGFMDAPRTYGGTLGFRF